MSEPEEKVQRWFLTGRRHQRTFRLTAVLAWYSGKGAYAHPTLRGFDLTLGLAFWSISIAYRYHRRPNA